MILLTIHLTTGQTLIGKFNKGGTLRGTQYLAMSASEARAFNTIEALLFVYQTRNVRSWEIKK